MIKDDDVILSLYDMIYVLVQSGAFSERTKTVLNTY